ncbi:septum formation family protein [Gordonia humi]|uniref:Septum formation-related domain-containing protein n=1 Tax=Gordonia humi TaxID=686429 RepID=A0A840EVP2_9ACTN|nr:septum formation family protein [Gordonia humi]MBB4134393.1 hypothetical protein [Gordonia humi]
MTSDNDHRGDGDEPSFDDDAQAASYATGDDVAADADQFTDVDPAAATAALPYTDAEYDDDDADDFYPDEFDQDEFDQDEFDQDEFDQDEDEPGDGERDRHGGPRHPLRLVLLTVLIGAVAAGGVLWARDGFVDHNGVATTVIGEGNAPVENDFTRSQPGDCLQWNVAQASEPALIDCAEPHRFEVAGALDTDTFPTSEFASNAPWPGPERFAAVRDENCPAIVGRYLAGGLDPQGRFSTGLMFPSKVQWERGARVLQCGIEQPGAGGVQEEFTGKVADIDQSFSWPAGTCIGIDKDTRKPAGEVVDCSEPHAFQTTGDIDLSQRFGARNSGKPWPSAREQNDYLSTICPTQTNRFFGSAAKFDETTLNVQWSVISEVSWLTGSRRVVCYVALPSRGGFATLVGDAREQVLIDGRVPAPVDQGPPGRSTGTAVPLPPGYTPDDRELPAPAG